jgi:hypothetical protein
MADTRAKEATAAHYARDAALAPRCRAEYYCLIASLQTAEG